MLLFCLPQDIHLHQICEYVFDALSELAWILPFNTWLDNSKETQISDAEALYIREKELCWQLYCFPTTSGTLCPAN